MKKRETSTESLQYQNRGGRGDGNDKDDDDRDSGDPCDARVWYLAATTNRSRS